MTRYTPKDIAGIADFIRHGKDRRPFTLLTGAGCSISAGIPLAPALIDKINTTPAFAPALHGLSEADRQDYGRVMARLTLNDRRDLLKPYLDHAKVNWAHIAIAAMVGAGYISRVLTFNFDNILARACGICGIYPATYDFVTGASNSTDHIVSPAIIHLHGQGYGLSMLNSDAETAAHAERLRPLLRTTMESSPLLVVGYSGGSDKAFPALMEDYVGRERLFWAGHGGDPAAHVQALLDKGGHFTRYIGGADADLFLVEIAQKLDCWPPIIFHNPIEHIRREISPIAEFPSIGREESAPGADVLSALKAKLDRMEGDPTADDPALRASIQLMKGDFDSVIRMETEGEAVPDDLLFDAYFQSAFSLQENGVSTRDPALFDSAAEKYAEALRIKPDSHDALNDWGTALGKKADATGDATLYDAAVLKFAEALRIKPDKHEALNNWGNALTGKADASGDAALYDAAGAKYAEALRIKPDSHEALNNWGLALGKKADVSGEATLYDVAVLKFAEALRIKPGNAYNLACVQAIRGDFEGVRRSLETCRDHGTLPSRRHLETDTDLDALRELDWFKDLLEQTS